MTVVISLTPTNTHNGSYDEYSPIKEREWLNCIFKLLLSISFGERKQRTKCVIYRIFKYYISEVKFRDYYFLFCFAFRNELLSTYKFFIFGWDDN